VTEDRDVKNAEKGFRTGATPESAFLDFIQKFHIEVKTQFDSVCSMLNENSSFIIDIKSIIQNRLEYDLVKEKAFDKLYEDMRQQRELPNILDRNIKPLILDLLLLYDNMKSFEKALSNLQNGNSGKLLKQFKYLLDDLLESLYRQEIIPIEHNAFGSFNSKLHKAVKTEDTEMQNDDFKVVKVVRDGFLWRDRVLRHQEVIISRFRNTI